MDSTYPHHTRRLFVLLLVLALVRGLIYATIVPLWHAADEANHAEYVLFILRENQLPQRGSVAASLRREILASLWENDGGTAIPGLTPGALLGDIPPPIPGPSEFPHPPGYYLLLATVLRPLAHHDVTMLAYAARLASVFLGVISIGVAILSARTLFVGQPWSLWAAPILVLFIPAHTFSTSTINNDQLAEVVISVFFYLWILAFKMGLSWGKVIGLVGITLIGLFTKRTTAISVPLSLVAVTMLANRRLSKAQMRLRWGIPLALMASLVCVGVVSLHPEAVAGWYSSTGNVSQVSQVSKNGKHSMRLVVDPANEGLVGAYQVLPSQALEMLRGKKVSFGAWVRGDSGSRVQLQILARRHQYQRDVAVTDEWQFYQVVGEIDQDASELRMVITAQASSPAEVYVDDLSLLTADSVEQSFLYNSSAESSAWTLRPWAKSLIAKLKWLRLNPNVVQSVLDVRETWRFRDILVGIVDNLFKLFWAVFGVREVYVGRIWFQLLTIVHLFAGVGLVRAWRRRHRSESPASHWQVELLSFALLAVIVAVIAAIARGYPLGTMRFVPAGRYLYVITVPYSLLMVTGIGSWIPRRYHSLAIIATMVMLVSFDALCMFYYIIPRWYG